MVKQFVDSTNLYSIDYDVESMILEIEFLKGGIYRYFNVPLKVYNALMAANSHGSYFSRNIRDKYDFKKLR